MIYLYQVSGKDIYFRHSNVTKEGTIHVAVIDEDSEEVLMSIVLPEFTLLFNKLDEYDCYDYLNLIIDRYESILINLKDEKGIRKFLKRGEKLMVDRKFTHLDMYYKFMRTKANRILASYEYVEENPLKRAVQLALNKIFNRSK